MDMLKTFKFIINFHLIIVVYFGADICKCMTAPPMKTNGKFFELKNIDGKTTSVHTSVVLQDIEFEKRKFYGENSTPNKWYKVQMISEKLVNESIRTQQQYNKREKHLSVVDSILSPQDDSSENYMNGLPTSRQNESIPKSLCHLCKVQASVGAYIISSNLSKYYEGMTRSQFQCSNVKIYREIDCNLPIQIDN